MNVVAVTRFDRDAYEIAYSTWCKGEPLVRHGDYYVTTRYDLDTMTEDEKVTLLKEMVNGHDFYFEYSDDHRVWKSGLRQRNRIRKIAESIQDKDLTNRIWRDRFGQYEGFTNLV